MTVLGVSSKVKKKIYTPSEGVLLSRKIPTPSEGVHKAHTHYMHTEGRFPRMSFHKENLRTQEDAIPLSPGTGTGGH